MPAYKSDLARKRTCVYRLYIGMELAYVGISCNPRGRFAQHGRQPWWREVTDYSLEWFDDRQEAAWAEAQAIHEEGPTYNIARPWADKYGVASGV